MNPQIYFIGGASASGKSTIARKLSDDYSLSIFKLDKFHDLLKPVICDRESLINATKNIALEVVNQLINSNTFCIIEGGWIGPKQASMLKSEYGDCFYPVYLGYPNADIETRCLMIKEGSHWLKEKTPQYAYDHIGKQIKGSKFYKEKCEALQIEFFDFTDFKRGTEVLTANFEKWFYRCTNGIRNVAVAPKDVVGYASELTGSYLKN